MNSELRKLPGVDTLLNYAEIQNLISQHGESLVKYAIRKALSKYRNKLKKRALSFDSKILFSMIGGEISRVIEPSLRSVINATGIVLHTNLGRAPFNKKIMDQVFTSINGYTNVEFDLNTGKRGDRNDHLQAILEYVTGAESAVVVNNNAAGVMLCLNTFAVGKEVIISRGELIEIGGSFRIPEIMESSGAKMVEVGTTNRTRISDYEKAINENTAILFKAHQSNFFIEGFTEEAELRELVHLAKKNNLIVIYDIGSGLLKKPEQLELENEPDVLSAINVGVDLVTFSGDKLLGGPQSGIIIGYKYLIKKIKSNPLMRALRVGKLTIASLLEFIKYYAIESKQKEDIPLFYFLNRKKDELFLIAQELQHLLNRFDIQAEIVEDEVQIGGGTLPKLKVDSFAILLLDVPAEELYHFLLQNSPTIVTILREGQIFIEVFVLFKKDIEVIARSVHSFLISCN